MEVTIEEGNARSIELKLLNVVEKIVYLEQYIEDQLSNRFTIKSDSEKFSKLLEEFKESNEDCLKQIEECRIDYINKTWYNLQDFYNFEDKVVNIQYYENFLKPLRDMKIRALYDLLKVNIIKFNFASKDLNESIEVKGLNSVLKKVETCCFLQCDFFLRKLSDYAKKYNINLEKTLGENNITEYNSILKYFSSTNEENVKRMKEDIPELFAEYVV